jgi:hypothetical protein
LIATSAAEPELSDQLSEILDDQETIGKVFREDRLRIGACCDLALEGQIGIMPAESELAYHAADPVKPGGLEFDAAANERRETALCETVLRHDNVAVVILGAAHDLSDNVPVECQYVRVSVSGLPRIKPD